MRQTIVIFANFCQIRKIKSTEKYIYIYIYIYLSELSKLTVLHTLGSLSIKDDHVKNVLQDIKQYNLGEQRKKNVNRQMFYRKFEKFSFYPMMTVFLAIHERVFHWLFWLGIWRRPSTFTALKTGKLKFTTWRIYLIIKWR